MTTPYFSIIIPMYNVEKYIKICVDSILGQTFQDFEVIIVDDVSTDNSYEICKKLYGDNEKIRLFSQEKNQGQGPARNIGLKNARGEYIFFVDSDDAIIPNALEKLYKTTKIQDNIDAIHIKGWYRIEQDDDKPLNVKKFNLRWEKNPNVGFLTENIPRRLAENWATNRIVGFVCNTIYKRDFLLKNEIEFPDVHCYVEDQILHLACMCFAKRYFILNDTIYIYRIRENSLMHNVNVAYGIKSMPLIAEYMQKSLDKIPSLDGNRILKEQCIIQTLDAALRDHARSLYNGTNIPVELDNKVYEAMLPIFGENTTLVKYLFHGFNNMWRQANIISQQNYLLRQREDLIQQQNKLIEQLKRLLDDYDKKII